MYIAEREYQKIIFRIFCYNFHYLQGFEEQLKKKKENQKRKPGSTGSGTDDTATPPPPNRMMHPGEQLKPRGFDRGLQAEKIIGATGKYQGCTRVHR